MLRTGNVSTVPSFMSVTANLLRKLLVSILRKRRKTRNMSMEKILREISYNVAIKEVSDKAMEIGRTKPYYMNFKEERKKPMKKELTRVVNAQITAIETFDDGEIDNILLHKHEEDLKIFLKEKLSDADDVQVEIHDFVLDKE